MIRTEHLTKRYRHTDALQDLNLEVPPASVFALAGPNGAGEEHRAQDRHESEPSRPPATPKFWASIPPG